MMQSQRYGLSAYTTDLAEPVSIREVRQYSRINDPDDDLWIKMAIQSARMMVEKVTHRQLMTKTWDMKLDEFPGATESIALPLPPLQSITSISYITSTGGTTTIDSTSILTDTASEPGRVAPIFNSYWPTARQQNAAVTIRFTAGYGSEPGNVPAPLRQAMLMLVGHWYENRETILVGSISKPIEMAFDALCGSYRWGGLH